jgi:hypothetical protein
VVSWKMLFAALVERLPAAAHDDLLACQE